MSRLSTVLCVSVLYISVSADSHANRSLVRHFTYGSLVRLIERENPQNISGLLRKLPDDLRKNFTLVYQSRSPHGDFAEPKLRSIDPLNPRVILFSPDGRLLIAFTGNLQGPGAGRLEVIHFEDDTAEFVLSELVLPLPREKLKRNPERCLSCHGADPRPIVDSYPVWPGFYGSVRDSFSAESTELSFYKKFLGKHRGHAQDIYSQLKFIPGTSVPPFLDPKDFDPSHIEEPASIIQFSPNTRLGMALTELNRKRIQRKMKSSPLYERYKYQLLAGLLGCVQMPLGAGAIAEARRQLIEENERKKYRLGSRGPDMFEIGFAENAAKIDLLSLTLGMDRADWSMAFENGSFSFFDGILSGGYLGKNYYLLEDFILEMFEDIALEDPSISAYYQTYKAYPNPKIPFGQRLIFHTALQSCDLLRERVKSLPALVAAPGGSAEKRSKETSLASLTVLETSLTRFLDADRPLSRCSHCHEGAGRVGTARIIPFGVPSELKARLQAKSTASEHTLMEEIQRRIQPHSLGHMPPGKDLTESEAKEIMQYLTVVVGK